MASALLGLIFLGLVFFLGASLGSFVNVVAWRLPLGLSLSRPASTCPSCGTRIALRHNIPVLGYLLLGGRCNHCKTPISLRYPIVEAVSGLLAVALWLKLTSGVLLPIGPVFFPNIVPFILLITFVMTLVALALIDLDWFLLPDRVTLPLALLGLLSSLAAPKQLGITLPDAALGALLAGGIPLVLGVLYTLVTGRVGLGGGDWKLLLGIGAWLGPKALPFVLLAASVQGLTAAVIFRRDFAVAEPPPLPGEARAPEPPLETPSEPAFRRLHIPFGPFLALGAIEWLFFQPDLTRAMMGLFGGRS
jgi:leader peptidase (prepilin peptidase)/N-methyltransferase